MKKMRKRLQILHYSVKEYPNNAYRTRIPASPI